MEKIQMLESTNIKITQDHLNMTNELTELNSEYTTTQNNLGQLLNQFNYSKSISRQDSNNNGNNFDYGVTNNFDVTNLLTSLNSVSESCDVYGDSNMSKSINLKEILGDVNKNLNMKKNQNMVIDNEEDFRCSIEGKTFSQDKNANNQKQHEHKKSVVVSKLVSDNQFDYSQNENVTTTTLP